MVTRPFLSTAAAERINALKRRGYATVQNLQDPPVWITIARRDDDTPGGWEVRGAINVIAISLTNRDPQERGSNQGAVETTTVGGFRAWAPSAGSLDVQQDDRFQWSGLVCVVMSVQPERNGVHEVQFRLLEGRR